MANEETPAARFRVVFGERSPQSTVTVWVSRVPLSANVPVAVTAWPASTEAEESVKELIDGAAFKTSTPTNRVVANSPSLRVIVTVSVDADSFAYGTVF